MFVMITWKMPRIISRIQENKYIIKKDANLFRSTYAEIIEIEIEV